MTGGVYDIARQKQFRRSFGLAFRLFTCTLSLSKLASENDTVYGRSKDTFTFFDKIQSVPPVTTFATITVYGTSKANFP